MSSINVVKKEYTHEGAPAARISPAQELERSIMSCMLWENTFYESGQDIADRIQQLCGVVKPETIRDIALRAKHDMRLRHVPLLLARELLRTEEGRKLFKEVVPSVITRVDDITEFLAIYWKEGKKPLAKQLKKHLGDSFRKFDEYQLAKYNSKNKAVKLRDAMRILRPKPENKKESDLWSKLIKGELATPDTWEVELSKTDDKKASWQRLVAEGRLGGMAMLRNIRNMRQAGVDDDLIKQGINKVNPGRLLPINFIMSALHNPQFEPDMEKKFFECFTKEKADGKTVLLIDVSGSMSWGNLSGRSDAKPIDVACSLAMIAREMFSDIRIFTFSNGVVEVPARRGFALKDAVLNSQYHGGTDLGGAVKAVTENVASIERLIVLTDEQSNSRVPQYNGYMINLSSNKNGVGYGQWIHIDGWSDKVLDYVLKYEASSYDIANSEY